MTLTLNLTPEIEQYLRKKAREQGVSLETYTLKLLTDTIVAQEKQTKLVNLLQSWIDEEDDQEQQETGEYLIQSLDENRLSDRPLFPRATKGDNLVSRVVLLDTGIIGLITNPKHSPESLACTRWLQTLIQSYIRVILPEIADYEIRRELLRANKLKGIKRLDELANLIEYLPITTGTMRQAALFWAQARQKGQPTAGDKTIDGDMILIAQAVTLSIPDMIIATTNVGHLSRFIQADLWQNIRYN